MSIRLGHGKSPLAAIALFVAALYEALSVIFVTQNAAPCQLRGDYWVGAGGLFVL